MKTAKGGALLSLATLGPTQGFLDIQRFARSSKRTPLWSVDP